MIWWRVSKSKLESFIWCEVYRGCLTNLRSDWLWLCFKSKWDKKRESHSHSHSHLPVIKSSASIGGWTGLTLPSHFCPGAASVNISEMCRPASLLLLLLSSLVTRWAPVFCFLSKHSHSSQHPDQSSGLVEKLISQRNTLIQPGISIR